MLVYDPDTDSYVDDGVNYDTSPAVDTSGSSTSSATGNTTDTTESTSSGNDPYNYGTTGGTSNGNTTQTFDDGSTLTTDASGNVVSSTNATDTTGGYGSQISDLAAKAGTTGFNALKNAFTKTVGGKSVTDWAALATAGAGLYSALAPKTGTVASQKPIPNLTASRQQIHYDDPNRQPGAQGRQYFTDTKYDGTSGDAQAQGILAAYKPAPAPAPNPYAGLMAMKYNQPQTPPPAPVSAASNVVNQLPVPNPANQMAQGGIAGLAHGGRYLSGATDGMADKIPTNIDGKQPAALSHGEFVIPADVVSHLGNGNSDAGANKLYEMMARVRKARTGNEHQGKQIDPNHFMPGGLARYAAGGGVMGFATGAEVPAASAAAPAPAASAGVTPDKTTSSTLAPWASDYVTNTLGQASAAADQPYQAYQGPLTAGASDLQNQAFAGASDIAKNGLNPTTFTSQTFGSDQAQQYMNPYLKNVLDPQMAELQRQADIQRVAQAGRLSKAGAFGGSASTLADTENNRNLLNTQNTALGQGYSNAYNSAMGQFNTEQNRGLDTQKATEQSRQASADFGLKSLADLQAAGAVQRGITSEGIAADKAQFEQQRDYPMQAAQYKLNLLQGLPIGSTTTSSDPGALANLQSQISGLGSLYQTLSKLGITTPTP